MTVVTIAAVLSFAALAFGLYRGFVYNLPMVFGDNGTAIDAGVGDPNLARYNLAVHFYQNGNYSAARDLASQAYSKLAESSGIIGNDIAQQKLAGDLQFLLGLSYEKNNQKSSAIEAYKQALRHTPDNLEAKFNLERLLDDQSKGGKGSGQGTGQQPGSGQGQSGRGKGI